MNLCSPRTILAAVAVGVAVLSSLVEAEAQPSNDGGKTGRVLLLVTETIERPDGGETVRYWWRTPSNPDWTETDRVLRGALHDVRGGLVKPAGGQRISTIYRRPKLSIDNASSLASILGAARLVVGEVRYDYTQSAPLPGMRAVHVESRLQVVDVAASEPEVLQTFETRRSVFGSNPFDDLSGRARDVVAERAAGLLRRIFAASSRPVGVEGDEPLLTFHDLRRGAALERIRRFVDRLESVESFRIRWASEGRIALEVNPGEDDSTGSIESVVRALEEADFEGMSLSRRGTAGEEGAFEFDVEIADEFERTISDQERDDGAE